MYHGILQQIQMIGMKLHGESFHPCHLPLINRWYTSQIYAEPYFPSEI